MSYIDDRTSYQMVEPAGTAPASPCTSSEASHASPVLVRFSSAPGVLGEPLDVIQGRMGYPTRPPPEVVLVIRVRLQTLLTRCLCSHQSGLSRPEHRADHISQLAKKIFGIFELSLLLTRTSSFRGVSAPASVPDRSCFGPINFSKIG